MRKNALCLFSKTSVPVEQGAPDAARIISGSPTNQTWNYRESDDGKFFSGIWKSTPGKWHIAYEEEEFCHIISGCSIITDASTGEETKLQAGDAFTLPAGFIGTWEVVNTTTKHYAIYLP